MRPANNSKFTLRHNRADTSAKSLCAFPVEENSVYLHQRALTRYPEEGFSFRRHACRLCARNKIRRSSRAESAGQSSLQNSNLITSAFESGTKEKGEREREFYLDRARDRITDSTWRPRPLRFLSHEDKLKKRRKRIQFYVERASAIVSILEWEIRFSLVSQLCRAFRIHLLPQFLLEDLD